MQLRRLESFLKYPEGRLYKKVNKSLKKLGYSPVRDANDKYIYAKGELPVLLVAHTDTIHTRPPEEVYFDSRHGVMWSPDGLGADDRAGVFAIMEIVRQFKCGVLLCTGEESGGTGVKEFIRDYPYNLDYKMAIELDRCGDNDCVYYDNDSYEFKDYIKGFGFKMAWGSFSDISILGPAWKINTVNLSVGYEDEHTIAEHLYVSSLMSTIERVRNILAVDVPEFEYRERRYYYSSTTPYGSNVIGFDDYWHDWKTGYGGTSYAEWCDMCGKPYRADLLEELEYGEFLVCGVCAHSHAFTCEMCGEKFIRKDHKVDGVCDDCFAIHVEGIKDNMETIREEDEKNDLTVYNKGDKIGDNRRDGDDRDGNSAGDETE